MSKENIEVFETLVVFSTRTFGSRNSKWNYPFSLSSDESSMFYVVDDFFQNFANVEVLSDSFLFFISRFLENIFSYFEEGDEGEEEVFLVSSIYCCENGHSPVNTIV